MNQKQKQKKKKTWIIFVIITVVLLIVFTCCGMGLLTAIVGILFGDNTGGSILGAPETSWYTRPKELGNVNEDGEPCRFELDGYIYQMPCPLSEFTKNGFELMTDRGVYIDIYGERQTPLSLDDLNCMDEFCHIYLKKDDVVLGCKCQSPEDSDMKINYTEVWSLDIFQIMTDFTERVHVYFPAKNGAIDPFYMDTDEMKRMNGGHTPWYPHDIYKNPSPFSYEVSYEILKWDEDFWGDTEYYYSNFDENEYTKVIKLGGID